MDKIVDVLMLILLVATFSVAALIMKEMPNQNEMTQIVRSLQGLDAPKRVMVASEAK